MPVSNHHQLPKHVAIIMDGNGRWAQKQGKSRLEGHKAGVDKSDEIITYASQIGVGYLTLYAFSVENWNRPQAEVSALMGLLEAFLISKKQKMLDHGIRLNAIGDLSRLPPQVLATLNDVKAETSKGRGMVLTLSLSYGSRDEILRAFKKMLAEKKNVEAITSELNEEIFSAYLDTNGMPDPDLVIRTSGEHRISNFLLWQGAYAEFVFEDCFWPDFTTADFDKAIDDYFKRERRFGKTSEQVNKS